MKEILTFIYTYYEFLYKNFGAEFVHSSYGDRWHSGVILRTKNIDVLFDYDYGESIVSIRSFYASKETSFCPLTVVRQLLLGGEAYDMMSKIEEAEMFQEKFNNISALMAKSSYLDTHQMLSALRVKNWLVRDWHSISADLRKKLLKEVQILNQLERYQKVNVTNSILSCIHPKE